jgi:hypothetical protein
MLTDAPANAATVMTPAVFNRINIGPFLRWCVPCHGESHRHAEVRQNMVTYKMVKRVVT